MPRKLYRRKLSKNQESYFKRLSTTIFVASEFEKEFLRLKEFTYLDLNSGINDFEVFKNCILKMKQNYFENAGDKILGIYERPPKEPFNFHAHIVIAKAIEELDINLIRNKWLGIKKNANLDSKFSIHVDKPWIHSPYAKLHYSLKSSKHSPWFFTKPYRESGSFHFYSNLGNTLPWAGKQLPKERFTPQQLKVLINQYFSTPPLKNKVESLFDFYDNYRT